MTAVTNCSDFGAQEDKVCHHFHCFPVLWSDGTGCHNFHFFEWMLSHLFHSLLSLSSRGSLVLRFLLSGWCHLHFWSYWYFSLQSWFQLVLHAAQRFSWLCTCSCVRLCKCLLSFGSPGSPVGHLTKEETSTQKIKYLKYKFEIQTRFYLVSNPSFGINLLS